MPWIAGNACAWEQSGKQQPVYGFLPDERYHIKSYQSLMMTNSRQSSEETPGVKHASPNVCKKDEYLFP